MIKIKIIPRKSFTPYLERKERWACIVAHRRAGKTVVVVQDLIKRAVSYNPKRKTPTRYAYIAPTRDQAKDIAWGYLKEYTHMIPGLIVNESDLKLTFPNGATIRLYSGDNYERMRGLYFDGVVLDEVGDIPPAAWTQVIRPTLSDYHGWATFIGTPKGKNIFYEVFCRSAASPDWYSLMLTVTDSGIICDSEIEDMRKGLPENVFAVEYLCDFNAELPGSIYGDLMNKIRANGQICDFTISKEPIYTFWDLGISDSTSMWFIQLVGQEIRVVDWYENAGESLAHYGEHIKKWEKDNDHTIDMNFLPHDGNARQLATGATLADSLREMGLNVDVVTRMPDIWVSIDKLRELMPRMWIHNEKCSKRWNDGSRSRMSGIECLESYKIKPDEPGKPISRKPLHDESSHSADSLRTFAEAMLQHRVSNQTYHESEIRKASPVIMGSRGKAITRY